MAMFTDVITLYQKQGSSWKRTVVEGVQWSDQIDLKTFTEEDAIFLGELTEEVTSTKGSRLSDLLATYPKGGIIRQVNDNSNRDLLKNIKVVVY